MSRYLWTAGDAAAATSGNARGGWPGGWQGVVGISIDTRSIAPGELFVALAGENRDGHAFVAQALAAGAGAAMVSHVPEGVAEDAPLLLVQDTLEALGALGAAARARSAVRVIAVTGDPSSPLATAADVVLEAGVSQEGGPLDLAPRASVVAQTAVLASLSALLQDRSGFDRRDYAVRHPAGALGERARE